MTQDSPRNNSYMFDPESPEELARLISWDRVTTQSMGGPLVGIEKPSSLQNILDLACGPGGWVLDVAFALPQAEVAGVDISKIMVDYANTRAQSQHLTNASFGVMDITQPLDFADASFDLVNARFIATVLPNARWDSFLSECTRILRPGGTLRITEFVEYATTSPSYARLNSLLNQAMQRINYGLSPDEAFNKVTVVLPKMLRERNYQNVRLAAYVLEFSTGTEAWDDGYHNLEVIGHVAEPLLTNLGLITAEELRKLTQQMALEAHEENFCAMQHFMTISGRKS